MIGLGCFTFYFNYIFTLIVKLFQDSSSDQSDDKDKDYELEPYSSDTSDEDEGNIKEKQNNISKLLSFLKITGNILYFFIIMV